MSTVRKTQIWVGIVALVAVALWYGLGSDTNEAGNLEDNSENPTVVAAQEQVPVTPEEQTASSQEEAVPAETEPLEEDDLSAAVPDTDAEAEEWNPGGDNEPTVEDVQQWTWLIGDLDRMIDDARPKSRRRLAPEEVGEKYLSTTLEYLRLEEEEQEKFEAAVQVALKTIGEARERMTKTRDATKYDEDAPETIKVWKDSQARFLAEQKEAAEGIVESLPVRPRTTLMREQALRWVLRYDFGMLHARRPASR